MKLNRALVEGRRAFRVRLAGIEAGIECERLEPLLSRLADREASAEDLAGLRPHLKTCLSCRTRLREFRATPGHVAALAPAVAAQSDGGGTLRDFVESVLGAVQHKAAALSERAHAAAELATGQKVAAVAASAAALAGGGTAIDVANHAEPPPVPTAQVQTDRVAPAKEEIPIQATPPSTTATTEQSPAPTAAAPAPPKPEPEPANEFDPAAAAQVATADEQVTPAAPARPATGNGLGLGSNSTSVSRGGDAGSGSGAGEFTP
jgi:hypothetical protein